MKAIGGIVAWLGGMAMLIGVLFVLMSLKNMADLFVWSAIGIIVGGFGLVLALAGWAIYRSGVREDQARNHWTS
jgi:hypothetical protein